MYIQSHLSLENDLQTVTTRCVIITGTPRLLWYNLWINRYKLAIFIHKRVGTSKKQVARLLRTRPTFSRSVVVSVGVLAHGRTSIHFVEPGVKVNGRYYWDVLLMQELLPDILQLSDFYVFQHDTAPVHWARDTVDLLTKETPDFIPPMLWPSNSPDLNPMDYKIWSVK